MSVDKNSARKTTIKKLKKGTYYVRIRTVNGKISLQLEQEQDRKDYQITKT